MARHDNGLVQIKFLGDLFYHGDQGMPFVDVAFKNIIAYRVTTHAHQEPKEYLWVLVLAIFAETGFPKIVLIACFKVEGGHIIKNNADFILQYF